MICLDYFGSAQKLHCYDINAEMLVRKEPHSCGILMKRRSMDYEGPKSVLQRSPVSAII